MSAARPTDERVTPRLLAMLSRVFPERVGFVWGALTNVVTTTVAFGISPHAELAHLMIINLLGAVLISTRYGMVVSTFTAVAGVLAFDYFCMPPVFAFALPDVHYVFSFVGMLLVALLVCWLNQGVRCQRAAAHASEQRTQALCQLSLDLSQVTGAEQLLVRAQRHLRGLFGARAELRLTQAEAPSELGFCYQAVDDRQERLGYIRVEQDDRAGAATERALLLTASADRIADALRRLALGDAARRAEVHAEMERNRSALLSAVSHDMKTPLASIMTAGSSLLSSSLKNDRTARELLETIVQESERMNAQITNLLSVTRLESGCAIVNKEVEALDDLVFTVLSRFSGRLDGRYVNVDIPADLPMVSVDPVLVDQLLVNLLENALRYTPDGSPLEIRAAMNGDVIMVEMCDRGPGVSAAERERVFDKFYRGQTAKQNDGGTGLGLTICRAVVLAHGGRIGIFERTGGGARVRFTLPLSSSATLARMSVEGRRQA
jgi:two-component system sensor histidine kinase KdpD